MSSSTAIRQSVTEVQSLPAESVIVQAGQVLSACTSIEQVTQRLLDLAVAEFGPLIARVVYSDGPDLRFAVHRDPRLTVEEADRFDKDVLVSLVNALTTESPLRPLTEDRSLKEQGLAAFCAPIIRLHDGELCATVAMIVDTSGDIGNHLARLDALTSFASMLLARTNILGPCLAPNEIAAASLAPRVSKFRSARQFCYSLTNSLCNQSQCEQVSVGIVQERRILVLAVSGCAQLKSESPGVTDLRQSMEECLDQGGIIVFPAHSDATTFPIHRQWSLLSGGSHVCSIPLRDGEEIAAVISFRRHASHPFTDSELEELTSTIQPFGGLLALVDRANQPLSRHIMKSFSELARREYTRIQKIMAAVVSIGLVWLLFGTMTYRPLCDSTVVSAELRHMTAPFEAQLGSIQVRAGDEVQAGDVLVEFETHHMRLDLAAIRAEIARGEVDVRTAIEAGDASTAASQNAHVRVLMARKLALEQRIESAQLRAPTDGMVVQSHFDKRLGQVFAQGESVLQFAPNNGWMLEVEVPEHIAILVKPGQGGWFASAACPNEKVEFCIGQINGSAEIIDEKNVFLSRAQLQHNPHWMRSGMQGVARITTTKKPVWWILFHNVIDWTRLRFWL